MNMLPTANTRADRHIAPFVSIGRSHVNNLPAPPAPRTSTQISAERDAALAEREGFEASRADLLLNGSSEDLLRLDTRIALAKVRQAQAEAQHAASTVAEAEARAEHETEQTRRDLHTPGSVFTVGAERYAADGSRWKRVA
ncbi:hypothetical protein ACRAWG_05795 [Methylobacterium sp. P31]